jgi:hypothetical protein
MPRKTIRDRLADDLVASAAACLAAEARSAIARIRTLSRALTINSRRVEADQLLRH